MNFVSFGTNFVRSHVQNREVGDLFLEEDDFSRLECIPFCNNNLIFHFFDTELEQVRLSTL